MDGVKQQIHTRHSESLENKHQFEMKKMKREMRDQLDKLAEKSRTSIAKVKKDYNKQLVHEKSQREVKLINIRRKNNDLIKNENNRFEQVVDELKASHETMLSEIKFSQSKEVENKTTEHTDYLSTAQQKFDAEKARLEA